MAAHIKTGNPWILGEETEVVAKGTIIRIKAIKFVGTTNVDACLLRDGSAKAIWASKLGAVATTGYQDSDYFGERGFAVNGLTVNTLDHGAVYIYLADSK